MFEQAFKNIDDVLWKEAGCTTELDYTEQISWLLFLKYLDSLEQGKADRALEEHTYRRIWLAGTLVPILVVIGVLLLYIRILPIPKQ